MRIKNDEISKDVEETYRFLEEKFCSLSLLEEREFKSEVLSEVSTQGEGTQE